MANKPCNRKLLAEGPVARAEYCKCGMTHITLGAFSVRLEPAAFEALASTLGRAATELREVRSREVAEMRLFLGQIRDLESDAQSPAPECLN